MARKPPSNPFSAYAWLAEAGWVFMAHSAQLWADPAKASARLAGLAIEKQRAAAAGMMEAGLTAMRGGGPDAGAKAAMAPVRRRVRANAKRLQKG